MACGSAVEHVCNPPAKTRFPLTDFDFLRPFEYTKNMYAYSSMIIHHTFTSNNSNLSMLSSHEMRYFGFSPTGIHMSTCQ